MWVTLPEGKYCSLKRKDTKNSPTETGRSDHVVIDKELWRFEHFRNLSLEPKQHFEKTERMLCSEKETGSGILIERKDETINFKTEQIFAD